MTDKINTSEHTSNIDLDPCRNTIRRLLSQNKINTSELARRTKLPQPTIHRLLTGKTEDPKLSTLTIIADYFSISLDQLLGNISIGPLDKEKSPSSTVLIPIISWKDAISATESISSKTSDNLAYLTIDIKTSKNSFALISKKSMEPKFQPGTIIIVDPELIPVDGDLIIVHYKNTDEATIRQLLLDGPKKEVHSIFNDSTPENITNGIRIIGVVIQTRYSYK